HRRRSGSAEELLALGILAPFSRYRGLATADRAGRDARLRQLAHRHLLGFDRSAGRLLPVLPFRDPGERKHLWRDRRLAETRRARRKLRQPRAASARDGG